jgi:hypothetical protein
MILRFLVFWFFALTIFSLQSVELTIDQPGIYKLGVSLQVAAVANDSFVVISASDVVFDLGGFIIQQTNSATGVNGIVVNSGFTNIVIRNGNISDMTNFGISIDNNCSLITMSNLIIERCGQRGITADGSINPVLNLTISDCQFYRCCQNAVIGANDAVVSLTGCRHLTFTNCAIANTNNPNTVTLRLILLANCSTCELSSLALYANTISAGSLTGLQIGSVQASRFSDIQIEGNSVTTGSFIGIDGTIMSASRLSTCLVLQNSATTTMAGFSLASTSSNLYEDCAAISNSSSGGTCNGFQLTGALGSSFAETFIQCHAIANSALNDTRGFSINGSGAGTLLRCISTNNSSILGTCYGIDYPTNSGIEWAVVDSLISTNVGTTASFGIRVTGAGVNTSLFSKDVALRNGIAPLNQFSGVAGTSFANPAANNLNSVAVPWTNIGVVS